MDKVEKDFAWSSTFKAFAWPALLQGPGHTPAVSLSN